VLSAVIDPSLCSTKNWNCTVASAGTETVCSALPVAGIVTGPHSTAGPAHSSDLKNLFETSPPMLKARRFQCTSKIVIDAAGSSICSFPRLPPE